MNIAGLTIGMSCCLLIFHYVSYERSYDRFEPKAGQIVRVRLDSYQKGGARVSVSYFFSGHRTNDKKGFSGSGKVFQTKR
ncbi:MAG: ABC transporter permease [Puia sp.]